jgi:hypothetical protein
MNSTHPKFPVEVLSLVAGSNITHVVCSCPRCGCNLGITAAMSKGEESIICKGKINGFECNGHYYLRGTELEFVGTVQ